MAALAHSHRHSAPTAQDASLARVSGQSLSRFARRQKPLSLKVTEAGQEQPLELPAVEAASVLNVSRPYLIKLLEEKVIPHRLVGKHRRILIDDVMAYKARIDAAREGVLGQLTAEAQEDDMGYSRT